VSRVSGGSVKRAVCRVMVGVAGLAVLGMTASLADAQTAHQAAFTLNDVMQSPFASDMLAAPTGTAVAWVFNAKGCSNIWVADPSHGAKARRITPYTEDDGFAIGELAWSPDTKSIAFTRRQSLEDETRLPQVARVLTGRRADRLRSCAGPENSPRILLPTQRTAVVDLDGGRENRPGATSLDCRRWTRKCIPSDALGDERRSRR